MPLPASHISVVPNCVLGKPAAFDLTVTSLALTSSNLPEASVAAAEDRKQEANDAKCSELGWVCFPLAVETYGCCGSETRKVLSQLASLLPVRFNSQVRRHYYALWQVSVALVRTNARVLFCC